MTVFIQKGDAPLTLRQATKRGLTYFNAQRQQFEREQGIITDDPAYLAWANQWINDNEVNGVNNRFNWALQMYREATDRLQRYRLAVGRAEVTEQIETGEFDPETGDPIFETVIVQGFIEPLPATVSQDTYDDEGNATGSIEVPNPAIVQDEYERDYAEAVIMNTPAEVKAF